MGLERYLKDKKNDRFEQGKLLASLNLSQMGGICLSLSAAFMHLRREGLSPQEIFPFLRDSKFRESAVKVQQEYQTEGDAQEASSIMAVFASVLTVLVGNRQAEPAKPLLMPVGSHVCNTRPDAKGQDAKGKLAKAKDAKGQDAKGTPSTMFSDLLSGLQPYAPPRLMLIFNCKGGKVSHTGGGHAIVVEYANDVCGIFDPNFGWMHLKAGYNNIDLAVALQTFKTEYDITDACTYQDMSE